MWSLFFFSMALDSSTTDPQSAPTVPLNPTQNLITINATAQLLLKLTPTNYFSWKAQFRALFYSLDLLGNLDGTSSCPSSTIVHNNQTLPNPAHTFWCHQDQLILYAILASVNEAIVPLVSSATSSHKAWTRLSSLYAKRSNQHIINLKDKLLMLTHDSSSVTYFLVSIKCIADELTTLGAPLVMLIFFSITLVGLIVPTKNSSLPCAFEILLYHSKNCSTRL